MDSKDILRLKAYMIDYDRRGSLPPYEPVLIKSLNSLLDVLRQQHEIEGTRKRLEGNWKP